MDENVDGFEQLMLLKQITEETGILHEAQIVQLKYWPLMLTNAVDSSFEFNFINSEIIFKLRDFKGKPLKDLDKRLILLKNYTKTLLGEKYSISIEIEKRGKNVRPKKSDRVKRKGRTRKVEGSKKRSVNSRSRA